MPPCASMRAIRCVLPSCACLRAVCVAAARSTMYTVSPALVSHTSRGSIAAVLVHGTYGVATIKQMQLQVEQALEAVGVQTPGEIVPPPAAMTHTSLTALVPVTPDLQGLPDTSSALVALDVPHRAPDAASAALAALQAMLSACHVRRIHTVVLKLPRAVAWAAALAAAAFVGVCMLLARRPLRRLPAAGRAFWRALCAAERADAAARGAERRDKAVASTEVCSSRNATTQAHLTPYSGVECLRALLLGSA